MATNKKREEYIVIEGAKVNNLKNISLKIPRNKLVVISGISGSGKSSLPLRHSLLRDSAVLQRAFRHLPDSFLGV